MDKHTVPNMVQGVSQQSPQSRRDTQCEAQFDMLNQAVEGATARPGFELVRKLDGGDFRGAFFYDIVRDDDERYTVSIHNGSMRINNFLTGAECTISVMEDVSAYLRPLNTISGAPAGALDKDNWCATTGEDDTYIACKLIKPQMGAVLSPSRPPEALFWFRAGGYKVTYQISLKHPSGTWYNWAYQTPDNSAPGNAAFITTDQICYALYNAMVTDPTNPVTGLGFSIARKGNIMRVWRDDYQEFDIETIDGNSGVQLSGLKGRVGGLEDIPKNGFDGMVFKVAGAADAEADDWFATFDSMAGLSDSSTQGAWVETVASDTIVNLAYSTMPLYLFNTGFNTFELSFGSWGERLSGDGEESAKDPSFVGRYIEDIAFDQRRLAIMSKGSAIWSRTNNAMVYFPDTARASLATAPIDTIPRVTQGIAILRKIVQANGGTYLWAEGIQLAVGHNANSNFSNASIEVDPASAFEWNIGIRPLPIGRGLMFTTSLGDFAGFTDVEFQDGRAVGDEDITEHVPEYIPADLIEIAASYSAKKLVAVASSTPNRLYFYEWRITSEGRVQSAWNTWRLPLGCTVLHVLFDKTNLILFLHKAGEGTFLVRLSVAPRRRDGPGTKYLTRMDFRVKETDCTIYYNPENDQTGINIPYLMSDAMDYTLREGQRNVLVAVRADSGDYKRGQELSPIVVNYASNYTGLVFQGDLRGVPFYAGYRIRASRRESSFYKRDQNGYVYSQSMTVARAVLQYAFTGYTRFELTNSKTGQLRRVEEFEGRVLGDVNTAADTLILPSGDMDCGVGEDNEEAVIDWINDSFLPSSWGGMTWYYMPTQR